MTPESLFAMTGPPVLLGWAILILAPRRFAFVNAVPQLLIPVGLSLIYGVLVLRYFAGAGGGFGSLSEVRQLFTSDWALLAGWIHYLAFDMAIGAMLARRMDRVGMGRVVQGPILIMTFLLGPIGFFLAILTEAALTARPAVRFARNSSTAGLMS
jgi:hypothetical protein